MSPKDEEDYYMLVRNMENSVNFVNQLPEYLDPRLTPTVSPSNRTYSVPERGSNPLNAWYCKVNPLKASGRDTELCILIMPTSRYPV